MTDKVTKLVTQQELAKRQRDAELADRYCDKTGGALPKVAPAPEPDFTFPDLPDDAAARPAADEPKPVITKEDLEFAVAELAKLSTLEAELAFPAYVARLGVPITALRSEVKKARRFGGAAIADMKAQPHWQVEPYPEPVSPSKLLARVKRRIKRHVWMTDEAATATALWIMFAWCHEAAVHSPILLVTSPEAECGKSTLFGLIKYMSPRGDTSTDATAQVLYRIIEKWHPTFLIDEADDTFKANPHLRSVINSGWTRGTGVWRCHPDTHEPELFETFGPKAIGMKGMRIPRTTLGRSIIVDMERKLPRDEVEDFAHIDDDDLAEVRSQLSRFFIDNVDALTNKEPQFPDGFVNRLKANWTLMLAIAERCGAGKEARHAAEVLSRRADEASLGVELLRDIRAIFAADPILCGRIKTEVLLHRLAKLEGRPWCEMPSPPYNGKQITPTQLAGLLKAYKVRPKQVRFGDDTFKGYEAEWFTKAYRYIPADPEEGEGDA